MHKDSPQTQGTYMQTNLAQFYTSVLVILHEKYIKKISSEKKKYQKKPNAHQSHQYYQYK